MPARELHVDELKSDTTSSQCRACGIQTCRVWMVRDAAGSRVFNACNEVHAVNSYYGQPVADVMALLKQCVLAIEPIVNDLRDAAEGHDLERVRVWMDRSEAGDLVAAYEGAVNIATPHKEE